MGHPLEQLPAVRAVDELGAHEVLRREHQAERRPEQGGQRGMAMLGLLDLVLGPLHLLKDRTQFEGRPPNDRVERGRGRRGVDHQTNPARRSLDVWPWGQLPSGSTQQPSVASALPSDSHSSW
jgi:hypothetical protein